MDSTLIEDKVRNKGVSDLLLGIAAKEACLDDRPSVQEQVKAERERLLVEGLWDELLETQLKMLCHPSIYNNPSSFEMRKPLSHTKQDLN